MDRRHQSAFASRSCPLGSRRLKVPATEASALLSAPRNSRRHVHHGKQSTLANQTPGIDADINFHDEVTEAAGVRLGLVWRVRRNQQPIAGFHLISLAAHHPLSAVFGRSDAVLFLWGLWSW